MPPRRTTSYALPGLLALRSWTTYELARQAQRSPMWFWPRAKQALRRAEGPRRLRSGLGGGGAHTGKRPHTIYDITPQGRSELALWMDNEPAARAGDLEAMVKVFLSGSGSIYRLRDPGARGGRGAGQRAHTG